MTIAISLKVNDGVVLASDSASTLMDRDANGNLLVANVYNNADKIFNLRKPLPIGAITWGAGGIGAASVATLVKDFRETLHQREGWNSEHLDLKRVATMFRGFIYDEKYLPEYGEWSAKPELGFVIAGYSTNQTMAEEYQILISPDGQCYGPELIRSLDTCGIKWYGQGEAITRLIFGYSAQLLDVLQRFYSVPDNQLQHLNNTLRDYLAAPLIQQAMPIQDAIDVAEFLVTLTIKFSRFLPGAATVGGPIEIAAITKHEGFKWIKRKHYYSRELNPEG
jgi:hypothetical protein